MVNVIVFKFRSRAFILLKATQWSMYVFRFNTTELFEDEALHVTSELSCAAVECGVRSNTMINVWLSIKTDFVFASIAETCYVFPQRRITANASCSGDRTDCTLYMLQ